jgi:hypothetical protein
MQSQLPRQLVFTLGMLVCGSLEAALAGALVGLSGVEGVVYSVLLCLIPGWVTIYVSHLLRHPAYSAYILLVGTAARLVFVLLGLLVISLIRPDLGFREFTLWLIVGYMVSLVLETWAVVLPLKVNARR